MPSIDDPSSLRKRLEEDAERARQKRAAEESEAARRTPADTGSPDIKTRGLNGIDARYSGGYLVIDGAGVLSQANNLTLDVWKNGVLTQQSFLIP